MSATRWRLRFGVGLVLPGLIVDTLGWRWIFWVMLAVTVAGIVAVRAWVGEPAVRSPGRVDLAGALLLTGGLVALLAAGFPGRIRPSRPGRRHPGRRWTGLGGVWWRCTHEQKNDSPRCSTPVGAS